jgi:hypothetical protein
MSDARENETAVAFGEQLLPYSIRMDLRNDPEFVKKYGKKVKAVGGSYSECRGHQSTRFVVLPSSEDVLINTIWAEFGGADRINKKSGEKMGTMVAQSVALSNHLPAWVTVQEISVKDPDPAYALRCNLAQALLHARARAIHGADVPLTLAEKEAHDQALAEKKAAVEKARREEAQSAVNALWALCATPELRAKLVQVALDESLGGALMRLAKNAAVAS